MSEAAIDVDAYLMKRRRLEFLAKESHQTASAFDEVCASYPGQQYRIVRSLSSDVETFKLGGVDYIVFDNTHVQYFEETFAAVYWQTDERMRLLAAIQTLFLMMGRFMVENGGEHEALVLRLYVEKLRRELPYFKPDQTYAKDASLFLFLHETGHVLTGNGHADMKRAAEDAERLLSLGEAKEAARPPSKNPGFPKFMELAEARTKIPAARAIYNQAEIPAMLEEAGTLRLDADLRARCIDEASCDIFALDQLCVRSAGDAPEPRMWTVLSALTCWQTIRTLATCHSLADDYLANVKSSWDEREELGRQMFKGFLTRMSFDMERIGIVHGWVNEALEARRCVPDDATSDQTKRGILHAAVMYTNSFLAAIHGVGDDFYYRLNVESSSLAKEIGSKDAARAVFLAIDGWGGEVENSGGAKSWWAAHAKGLVDWLVARAETPDEFTPDELRESIRTGTLPVRPGRDLG
jgi:hypothetical protein